ncbi:MAG: hypothetical protein PWP65_1200 [Clostridia bacterium]|nr:hypothetical protein [Clostridia bacterium]
MAKDTGPLVAKVRPGSIAAAVGLEPGDKILSINGEALPDIIAYNYACAAEELALEVIKKNGEKWLVDIEKEYHQDLGLEFEEAVFDGIRRCANRCLFCFVDQMPKGLRKSLYVKDDDYRFSFLNGNFITLTNLNPVDRERLKKWRLSPLYISVHTTNPALRVKMLRNRRAGRIIEYLQELAAAGLHFHAQVVLCPGLNDGPELDRTIQDLVSLWPAVESIAVVPVGLTAHRQGLYPLKAFTSPEAGQVLARVCGYQQEYRRRYGKGLVYAADEFYFLAGKEVPPAKYYDGFPQKENGVGLTRLFLDSWRRAGRKICPASGRRRVAVVTGKLAAPLLAGLVQEAAARADGLEVKVVGVENITFGPQVTVAGLLAGRDLIAGLEEVSRWLKEAGGYLALPDIMLRSSGEPVFLDDLAPADLERELGVEVRVVETSGLGLWQALGGRSLGRQTQSKGRGLCPNPW